MTEELEQKIESKDAPAPKIGPLLKAERLKKKITLDQAAKDLCMRKDQLLMLEEERFDELPGGAYTVGFLRGYSRYLKLEEELIIGLYREKAQKEKEGELLAFPVPLPQEGVPKGKFLFIALLLLLGAYIAWKKLIDVPPSAEIQNIPLQEIINQPLSLNEDLLKKEPQIIEEKVEINMPLVERPEEQEKEAEGIQAELSEEPSNGALEVQETEEVQEGQTEVQEDPFAKPLILKAQEPSWVEVKDPKGHVLIQRTLKPNETRELPKGPGYVLSTGNAGGLVLLLEGQNFAPLGKRGEVKSELSLDPKDLAAFIIPAS